MEWQFSIILAITVTLFCQSPCFARVITPNALASALQNILSPANTDKALQMINVAATRANKNIVIPEMARTVLSNECGLPARTVVASNSLPAGRIVARNDIPLQGRIIANELGMPRAIITNDGVVRMITSEPRNSEMLCPVQQKRVRQVVKETVPNQVMQANLVDSLILPKEIYQAAPFIIPQESVACPYQMPATALNPYLPTASPAPSPFMPASMANPYLPVASPQSAMSPIGLPPPTQSKGQFLRKIPIPPPTL